MAIDIPPIPIVEPTHECISAAAERYNLPIRLLYSVLQVEGGKAGLMSRNKNGTYDLGPMQINSIWLKSLQEYIHPSLLLYNGCVNVAVGAWLLRSQINQAGDFWKGVGNYHSKTPHFHARYVQKVYQASLNLQVENGSTKRSKRG